ncbi:hypothetical protein FQZ97_826430 [compost metagenome]
MAQQQAEQVVALGVVEQAHGAVLGEVPEQPGIVVSGDAVVLPDPGVAQHADQAVAVIELDQVGRRRTVGPDMGAIVGIVEVKSGVETEVGRCVLVFQVELGQFRVGAGCGLGFLGLAVRLVEVVALVLLQAQAIEQQVAAFALVLIPQAFGDEHQVAALGRPGQQAFDLARAHALAIAEQQQGLPGTGQARQPPQVLVALHLQALLAEKVLGGQVRVGLRLGGRAVLEGFFVGLDAAQQVEAEQGQAKRERAAEEPLAASAHVRSPSSNRRRQSWHRVWRSSSGGRRWP